MTLNINPMIGKQYRRSAMQIAIALQAVFLLLSGATATAQEGNRLQDIQVLSLPGQRVELKLILSETAPEPLSFTIEDPARIALDLPGTSLGLSSRRRDVNLGALDTVLTAEANGRTRVVLNLGSMVAYETQRSGNTITVTLGADNADEEITTQFAGSSAPSSASTSYASSGARRINSVDFRRTRDGGGRVLVSLSDPSTPVDIRQEGGRVVAIFKDTSLPAELLRRLDVVDFATPVTTVDTLRTNQDTRIIISADGNYEQLAYQSDTEFTIEINPSVDDNQVDTSILLGEQRIRRAAADAQLPGHRDPRRVTAAGGNVRPQHRGIRHGAGQCDTATAQCSLGSGSGYRHDHQGSGHAPERQCHPGCAG